MDIEGKSAHIMQLAEELLKDFELQQLEPEHLLFKCARLARLSATEETRLWIRHEIEGYNNAGGVSLKYMTLTGRWTDYEKRLGYYWPLAQVVASIKEKEERMKSSLSSGTGGNPSIGAIQTAARIQDGIGTAYSKMSGIRSRVLGLLYQFVTDVYYECKFADVAKSVFDEYKQDVDTLIAAHAGDVMTKFPAAVARLREGDNEAVSQALTTCRRIIEAFADAVFPPAEQIERDGAIVLLDASKHKNRLNEFVRSNTESKKRRERLRKNLEFLYDRVCAGVHSDVTHEEAFSLFLNVYLLLGEILTLSKKP
ncbi:hypothetical protein PX860_09375 [Agrobacterium leguminum]|uniref:AbiTii domain-containing protein n=1 Tax=Agrobacterium leguminum TaxID=2792015 RepID=UPI002729AC8A|nr:hypothetical protein [Agrobacterium leguminum]WLD95791.1 hypothetical protein PX860_09375 [Agrobacterium leguminum]